MLTIINSVKSLWALLHDLNDIPNEGLSTTQKMELDIIVQRGREVLLEIEHKLSKYNVLAFATSDWKTKAVRAWSRVKWDPAEVDSMRSRITYCLSLWNLVMGKINQYERHLFLALLMLDRSFHPVCFKIISADVGPIEISPWRLGQAFSP